MRSIGHRGAAGAKQSHEGSGQSILLVGVFCATGLDDPKVKGRNSRHKGTRCAVFDSWRGFGGAKWGEAKFHWSRSDMVPSLK